LGVEEWTPSLTAKGQSEAETIEMQHRRFELNRRGLREESEMLGQRIAELEAGIAMLERQNDASEREQRLLQREIDMVEGLYKQGLMPLPRLLQLQRDDAAIDETTLGRAGTIARSKAQIGFLKTQMQNIETKYYSRVGADLEDTAAKQIEITRKLQEAEDVLRRTIIFAPIDGIVTQMRHHTIGAVLQPGEPLLYVVPSREFLIVEARIRPVDVDAVTAKQDAQVRLLAYNQRSMTPLRARVETVSADLVRDQRSGEGYYLARLEMLPDGGGNPRSGQVNGSVQLTAGMPVEVMIATQQKSIIGYVLAPIADVFRRSLRET
jgi:HlyD family type I secretion membrane fusion protein